MIKVISCKIFEDYLNQLPIDLELYDIEYLPIQSHNYPHRLAREIQSILDRSQSFDKIILLYGVCGSMIFDVKFNQVPTYIIKAHDCASILLGGFQRFKKHFQEDLSRPWTCKTLLKNNSVQNKYQEWVEQYGQEQADYLQEILMQECTTYISMGENVEGYKDVWLGDLNYLNDILLLTSNDLLLVKGEDKIVLTNTEDVLEIK